MSVDLAQTIQKCVSSHIDSLILKISKQFNISVEDLQQCVNGTSSLSNDSRRPSVSNTPRNEAATSGLQNGARCQHVFVSGKNKGQACGDKVSAESKTGIYCKTHLKNEDKNMFLKNVPKPTEVQKPSEDKKIVSQSSVAPRTVSTATTQSGDVQRTSTKKKDPDAPFIVNPENIKKVITERTGQLPIKKNKWGNYEHEPSRLVFNKETREVYAKQLDDGTCIDLTRDDIDLAKTLGFPVKIPSNLPSTTSRQSSSLYDDEDDDELLSDVEDDDEDDD